MSDSEAARMKAYLSGHDDGLNEGRRANVSAEADADKPAPSFAPTYAAAAYPDLAKIARKYGYALAVHGSLQRDLDLIAIPWTEKAGEPGDVLKEITEQFAFRLVSETPSPKPHGRVAYTLSIGWGNCAIDLQFMPKERDP